ncbi:MULTISPECIES: hypothetical protein [unclassified Kribbella]|uniref:hypothetical protein n=1 Tax=unclassified Kribbella TaxID=2644121 RepID=UPI0033C3209A
MTRDEAERRLSALTAVRDSWLADKVPALSAKAVWLIGSLGQGGGDRWSDLDLLVVDGDCPLDDAVLTIEMPENGPVDGNYIGAKFVARGEVEKATAMATMLSTTPDVAGLSAVLSRVEGHEVARALVGRFLEVVGALR